MVTELVIGFREALEASLIIGIMLAVLRKSGASAMEKHVLLGAAAGIVLSGFTALAFSSLAIGFEAANEQLFEAATMLVAAAVLSYMMLLMARTAVTDAIGRQVRERLAEGGKGLFALSLIAVYREGVETVLLLSAAAFSSSGLNATEFLAGVGLAVFVGWLAFEAGVRVSVKTLFRATSAILILFAAGLTSHAVAELQEAGAITFATQTAWDSSGLLPESSVLYAGVHSLFGYAPTPTVLQALVHVIVLLGLGGAYYLTVRRPRERQRPATMAA